MADLIEKELSIFSNPEEVEFHTTFQIYVEGIHIVVSVFGTVIWHFYRYIPLG
jgi:hypothetical protein